MPRSGDWWKNERDRLQGRKPRVAAAVTASRTRCPPQIYDPDGVTRCRRAVAGRFPRLERKVDVVIRSMQKRRSAHKVVARSYAAELCHMRSQDCAPSPSSVSRMSEEEFEAFEAAVCAICPPQGRLRGALRTTESAAADEEWPRPVSDDD